MLLSAVLGVVCFVLVALTAGLWHGTKEKDAGAYLGGVILGFVTCSAIVALCIALGVR